MPETIDLDGIAAEVIRKCIKHMHLSVHPPTGRIRISAPEHMTLDTIRVFAISKLPWIKSQQRKVRAQKREAPRDYMDRESHYLWGASGIC
jgi:predicted metal-dependent hydrolase